MAGNSGPKVDGTGMDTPKESMPKDTVDQNAMTKKDSSSASGTWIHKEGPQHSKK